MNRAIQADDAPRPTTLFREIMFGAMMIPLIVLVTFATISYLQARSLSIETSLEGLEALASVQEGRVQEYVEAGEAGFELIATRGRMLESLARYNGSGDPEMVESIATIMNLAVQSTDDVLALSVYDLDMNHLVDSGVEAYHTHQLHESLHTSGDMIIGTVVRTDEGNIVHLIGGGLFYEGEMVGSLVISQPIEPLVDMVSNRSGLGDTGETIIAQATPEGPQFIAPLRFDSDATLNRVERADNAALPMNQALAGAEGRTDNAVDYRGEQVFAFTRHVEDSGWGIVVKRDVSEVMQPIDDYAWVALVMLLAAIAVALVAAVSVAEKITAPIRRLAASARAVVEGKRDTTVETQFEGEIGDLVEAFNTMTTEVNAMTRGLEGKVRERTVQLEEKNAQLAEAMEAKEVFLAGVSHEVRSPLTAMMGFIDLVTDSGESLDPEDRAQMLTTVSKQAEDVLNLIEDLLAAARAESGSLSVASVRVDLGAQARQVIEGISHGSRSSVEFVGGEALALADPARTRQIVRNLLTNAMRYGGPEIRIGVGSHEGHVCLEVRDNGDGVSKEDRTVIFDAYGQADGPKKVAESVGLGLHVSQELARLMGGELSYDYENGWSIFHLGLGAYSEAEAEAESPKRDIAAATVVG